MSLVGFKVKNHPQQVAKPHVDDRALPAEDFQLLNAQYRFTIDAAASPHNAKLPRFFSSENCGLAASWAGERVYCNPPLLIHPAMGGEGMGGGGGCSGGHASAREQDRTGMVARPDRTAARQERLSSQDTIPEGTNAVFGARCHIHPPERAASLWLCALHLG